LAHAQDPETVLGRAGNDLVIATPHVSSRDRCAVCPSRPYAKPRWWAPNKTHLHSGGASACPPASGANRWLTTWHFRHGDPNFGSATARRWPPVAMRFAAGWNQQCSTMCKGQACRPRSRASSLDLRPAIHFRLSPRRPPRSSKPRAHLSGTSTKLPVVNRSGRSMASLSRIAAPAGRTRQIRARGALGADSLQVDCQTLMRG
jgi:hypothetical protein